MRDVWIVLLPVAFIASVAWVLLRDKNWTYADEPLRNRLAYLALLVVVTIGGFWWTWSAAQR